MADLIRITYQTLDPHPTDATVTLIHNTKFTLKIRNPNPTEAPTLVFNATCTLHQSNLPNVTVEEYDKSFTIPLCEGSSWEAVERSLARVRVDDYVLEMILEALKCLVRHFQDSLEERDRRPLVFHLHLELKDEEDEEDSLLFSVVDCGLNWLLQQVEIDELGFGEEAEEVNLGVLSYDDMSDELGFGEEAEEVNLGVLSYDDMSDELGFGEEEEEFVPYSDDHIRMNNEAVELVLMSASSPMDDDEEEQGADIFSLFSDGNISMIRDELGWLWNNYGDESPSTLNGRDDEYYDEEDALDFLFNDAPLSGRLGLNSASRKRIEELEKTVIEEISEVRELGNCCICLEEFLVGSEVTRMPCHHCFHGDCIVEWLEKSGACPLCRFQML